MDSSATLQITSLTVLLLRRCSGLGNPYYTPEMADQWPIYWQIRTKAGLPLMGPLREEHLQVMRRNSSKYGFTIITV